MDWEAASGKLPTTTVALKFERAYRSDNAVVFRHDHQ